jgi:hypothetical protein
VESSTRAVYLDLNHWYALGEANAGTPRSEKDPEVLKLLRALVNRNLIILPLSTVHYMELTENPRDDMRQQVAPVMAELSRFRTFAPMSRIVTEEIDLALNARFGRPAFPETTKKFGFGIGFAFGHPLRFHLETHTEEDRLRLEERVGMSIDEFESELNVIAEYMFLTGPPKQLRRQIPGYDPYAARKQADRDLASFNVMVNTLRTHPEISKRPLDAIVERQFLFEFLDYWVKAEMKAGFSKTRRPFDSKDGFTEFLMSLPSRRVAAMLQFHYLKDVHREWKISDLRDIAALSGAIPYCDVVVTDKKAWDASMNRAHLDKEFDTIILHRLADLPAHVPPETATANSVEPRL